VNAQFPVRVISELTLFDFHDRDILSDAYGYAIQMALKLLVSKIVKTEFYLTLDADLILLEPTKLASILLNQINRSENSAKECSADNTSNCATNINAAANIRAIYEDESRSVHNNWWSGSSSLLGLDSSNNGTRMHLPPTVHSLEKNAGFSVTPAILSTYGSLVTLADIKSGMRLCQTYRSHMEETWTQYSTETSNTAIKKRVESGTLEMLWIRSFGQSTNEMDDCIGFASVDNNNVILWSEYTLYRLVLDRWIFFNELQISESHEHNGAKLHCHDVWFKDQLAWNAEEAIKSGCLFSVIQPSTGVNPSHIRAQLDAFIS